MAKVKQQKSAKKVLVATKGKDPSKMAIMNRGKIGKGGKC